MNKISQLSSFLIGFSFVVLMHTPISYGISLALAIILIIFSNLRNIRHWLVLRPGNIPLFFFTLFTVFLLISSLMSIDVLRSLSVSFYLIFFIVTAYFIYKHLTLRKKNLELTLTTFSYSIIFCTLFVFIYNILNLDIDKNNIHNIAEVRRFKGRVSLLTILVCLFPFLSCKLKNKKLISIILFLLLIPIIIISNSKSSILGILGGFLFLLLFFLSKFFKKKIIYLLSLFIIFVSLFIVLSNYLPKNFDTKSIKSTELRIPKFLLDPHRQFIWGFVIESSKNSLFFGIGPDTSNFIADGQRDIGHPNTGDMNFIPSHPHNFFLELILEIGIFGTLSFLLLILSTNYYFIKKTFEINSLVFFNGYFWTSSLVNFSFWNAWWQGSYFLILAILFSLVKKNQLK